MEKYPQTKSDQKLLPDGSVWKPSQEEGVDNRNTFKKLNPHVLNELEDVDCFYPYSSPPFEFNGDFSAPLLLEMLSHIRDEFEYLDHILDSLPGGPGDNDSEPSTIIIQGNKLLQEMAAKYNRYAWEVFQLIICSRYYLEDLNKLNNVEETYYDHFRDFVDSILAISNSDWKNLSYLNIDVFHPILRLTFFGDFTEPGIRFRHKHGYSGTSLFEVRNGKSIFNEFEGDFTIPGTEFTFTEVLNGKGGGHSAVQKLKEVLAECPFDIRQALSSEKKEYMHRRGEVFTKYTELYTNVVESLKIFVQKLRNPEISLESNEQPNVKNSEEIKKLEALNENLQLEILQVSSQIKQRKFLNHPNSNQMYVDLARQLESCKRQHALNNLKIHKLKLEPKKKELTFTDTIAQNILEFFELVHNLKFGNRFFGSFLYLPQQGNSYDDVKFQGEMSQNLRHYIEELNNPNYAGGDFGGVWTYLDLIEYENLINEAHRFDNGAGKEPSWPFILDIENVLEMIVSVFTSKNDEKSFESLQYLKYQTQFGEFFLKNLLNDLNRAGLLSSIANIFEKNYNPNRTEIQLALLRAVQPMITLPDRSHEPLVVYSNIVEDEVPIPMSPYTTARNWERLDQNTTEPISASKIGEIYPAGTRLFMKSMSWINTDFRHVGGLGRQKTFEPKLSIQESDYLITIILNQKDVEIPIPMDENVDFLGYEVLKGGCDILLATYSTTNNLQRITNPFNQTCLIKLHFNKVNSVESTNNLNKSKFLPALLSCIPDELITLDQDKAEKIFESSNPRIMELKNELKNIKNKLSNGKYNQKQSFENLKKLFNAWKIPYEFTNHDYQGLDYYERIKARFELALDPLGGAICQDMTDIFAFACAYVGITGVWMLNTIEPKSNAILTTDLHQTLLIELDGKKVEFDPVTLTHGGGGIRKLELLRKAALVGMSVEEFQESGGDIISIVAKNPKEAMRKGREVISKSWDLAHTEIAPQDPIEKIIDSLFADREKLLQFHILATKYSMWPLVFSTNNHLKKDALITLKNDFNKDARLAKDLVHIILSGRGDSDMAEEIGDIVMATYKDIVVYPPYSVKQVYGNIYRQFLTLLLDSQASEYSDKRRVNKTYIQELVRLIKKIGLTLPATLH